MLEIVTKNDQHHVRQSTLEGVEDFSTIRHCEMPRAVCVHKEKLSNTNAQ